MELPIGDVNSAAVGGAGGAERSSGAPHFACYSTRIPRIEIKGSRRSQRVGPLSFLACLRSRRAVHSLLSFSLSRSLPPSPASSLIRPRSVNPDVPRSARDPHGRMHPVAQMGYLYVYPPLLVAYRHGERGTTPPPRDDPSVTDPAITVE